jgi:hypothetical protein
LREEEATALRELKELQRMEQQRMFEQQRQLHAQQLQEVGPNIAERAFRQL